MDVISEIKKFEQHPERAKFSTLQVNDFYKTLSGQAFKFEAIISSVKKGIRCDYDIYASTYAYTIIHNPVADRDYINWAPDINFVCEAAKEIFKFNPLTDLIKGDRFHCTAVFVSKEDSEIRVKINSFQKVSFLEIEKEKDILEKRFNDAYQEQSVFAPQRQHQKRTLQKATTFFAIGVVIGVCIGLFWGCTDSLLYDENASILGDGVIGGVIGGCVLATLAILAGLMKPATRI